VGRARALHWWLEEIALVASERDRGIGLGLVRAIMAAARAATPRASSTTGSAFA
jgi:hypothetical protein